MAFILADRVQETATANTTVSFTLSGAIASYQSFAAIGNTNNTYYGATDGTNWEVGFGTYSTTGPTLTRDTILSSSNSGSAVTFSGTVTVWCDYPAGKQISSDYPNALGVVTPSSIVGTTITGQTGVLRGTGQNFLLRSSDLTNAAWTQAAVTLTGSQSDPFGGTTAVLMNNGTTSNYHYIVQNVSTLVAGVYTFSVYAKAGTANYAGVYSAGGTQGALFNLTTGAFTGNIINAPTSYSSVNVGNGWWRLSIVVTTPASGSLGAFISENGTSSIYTGTSQTVYISAPQIEVGSTLNTYIPTTTTAVYGTPTLSFSGVSTLGLESNGALFLQPAGTGAIQAQTTTSTTAGGNVRGANAVDWQTARNTAAMVASGSLTAIGGGYGNTASGIQGAISGGTFNTVSGTYNFVGAGFGNTATLTASSVVGGQANSAGGFYNFIGGGFTNSGTATAIVTTQSGTMNGTTAVTLSGSNANIKVGQIIFGTSIAAETYVAAISGTALTLSKNASGSSTSTLSFYTPHGIVVGGGNNQATGSYSFIGGGGDAGTASFRNTASGDWSVVCGGTRNTASGIASFVGGGGTNGSSTFPNTSSGLGASVVAGFQNASSGFGAFIGGGYGNTANSQYSAIMGGQSGITRGVIGSHVFPACAEPISNVQGVSQAALLVLGVQTTDATATALRSTTAAAGTTNQLILPNNSAYTFKGTMIANVTGGAASSSWEFRGAIERGANAASTVLVGTPRIDNIAYDAPASFWTFTLTADTTNGGLRVTVTGQASTTIRWVCSINTVEVTY